MFFLQKESEFLDEYKDVAFIIGSPEFLGAKSENDNKINVLMICIAYKDIETGYIEKNKAFQKYLSSGYEVNYFDNQRSKANGNISQGEYIARNVDIENTALIIFDNAELIEVEMGDNVLNAPLNAPFTQ